MNDVGRENSHAPYEPSRALGAKRISARRHSLQAESGRAKVAARE